MVELEETALDTIDLEEELGKVDAMLDTGAYRVAADADRSSRIEMVLVAIADGLWAVIGLVLWLPQAVRAILAALLRTVHAALTHQSSERAIAGIRRVSRFYVDRFLHRTTEGTMVARRHELRVMRMLFEVVWAAAFYLLLLWWLSPATFAPIWQRLSEVAVAARDQAVASLVLMRDAAAVDLADLDLTRLQVAATLTLAVLLGLALGMWVGRRR